MSPSKDETVLASLGYRQELKRHFSWMELLGLSFSIIGVVQSIAAVLVYSIPYAGAAGMIWGWLVPSVFLIFIALAMAELGSAQPTCGGLYYWTFMYSSDRYRNVLSWLVGYINTIGYISSLSGANYSVSLQIISAAIIGTGGTYSPTTAQIYGVMVAVTFSQAMFACLATKVMARLQILFVILNMGLFFGVIIALPAVTPAEFKNSASFVFGSFDNFSAWPNGFSFILSFLAATWTVGALDSSVHISEEAKNANVAVPRAIIMSVSLGCILGWAVNIALAFHMGSDFDVILSNPIGPMASIALNSFGRRGTLALFSLIIIALYASCLDLMTAASRQIFAFSRDSALPLSGILYRINKVTCTPMNCVIFAAIGSVILALLSFASPAAIGAVYTLPIICQYVGYSIPIMARFLGGKTFVPGPFTLGALGAPVAFVAVAFMLFMSVIFFFPTQPMPVAETMNYGIVVFMGVVILSMMYYYFPIYGGIYWFSGPISTIGHVGLRRNIHGDLEDEKTSTN